LLLRRDDERRSDVVLQVKQAFYTYAQNVRLAGVNEANVRNQQDHLALAQARLRSGLGLPSDVMRAQTAVADAILNLSVARNNASTSRVNRALLNS
jgi:outer membrane protein TolC